MFRTDSKRYPSEVKERVKRALRKELGVENENLVDEKIDVMTKVEIMDKYIDSYEKKMNSSEICHAVHSIFKINLDGIPDLSKRDEVSLKLVSPTDGNTTKEVIDSYLEQYEGKASGVEIRKIINHIFGINLDAISSLEGARISIYSKGLWIIQHEKDLFVVHTGTGDIDVKVFPTKYFIEQTGVGELPNDLQQSLNKIGFSYDKKTGSHYFSNPSGEAVPDTFKGQTIKAIIEVIRKAYSHL